MCISINNKLFDKKVTELQRKFHTPKTRYDKISNKQINESQWQQKRKEKKKQIENMTTTKRTKKFVSATQSNTYEMWCDVMRWN